MIIDFKDPKVVIQLAKAQLNADFGLKIHLPENHLCPMVGEIHSQRALILT